MDLVRTRDLVERTLAGDKTAFTELVEAHQGMVFSLAYRRAFNHSDVQDIAQEAFLRCYRDLGKLRKPARFASWLYGVVLNVARERGRAQKENVSLESVPEPAYDQSDTTEETASDELLAKVAKLPPEYRIPLTLRYIEDMSYREISEILGIGVSSARSRVHRAKIMLRK